MSISKEQYEEMQRRVDAAKVATSPIKDGVTQSPVVVVDIDPIGAPRQSRRDAWKPRPAVVRYRAWKDQFVAACRKAGWSLGSELHVEFHIAMPPSWSKKKKAEYLGGLHQQRPDIDNLSKAVMDAFRQEDSHVASIRAVKRWAERGRIILYRQ